MVSLQELQQMDNEDFEHFVAEIWSAMGYDTQVTQGGSDRGIDVVATTDEERVMIQAKRYSSGNKVGAPDIREYSALYQQEGATDVVVVTTSEFSSDALELAPEIGVTVVDGEGLVEMIGNDVDEGQLSGAGGSNSDSIINALAQIGIIGTIVSFGVVQALIVFLRDGGLKIMFYGVNIISIVAIILSTLFIDGFGLTFNLAVFAPLMILSVIIYLPVNYLLSLTEESES